MRVVKFGAVWCPGCIIMKPRWAEIEAENPWLKNEMYDYDNDKDAVEKYNITDTLPTFVFLDKNDKEFLRLIGEIDKKELISIVNENKDK